MIGTLVREQEADMRDAVPVFDHGLNLGDLGRTFLASRTTVFGSDLNASVIGLTVEQHGELLASPPGSRQTGCRWSRIFAKPAEAANDARPLSQICFSGHSRERPVFKRPSRW
jgi:hypothetical protein